tara:strand:+ start:501 stop:707 length:207 start_codon:yes stop_codon:yes gene_type:complete
MDRPLAIGTLIHFRGSIGVVIDEELEAFGEVVDGEFEPEIFIRVYWHDEARATWEEWETNMKLFKVIG